MQKLPAQLSNVRPQSGILNHIVAAGAINFVSYNRMF